MMAASWSVGKWVDRETIIKRLRDKFRSEEDLRKHMMAQTAKVSLMMEELEQLGLEFMGLAQEDLPPKERH
jgi:microsomal dipeptidase-like Zn-dependent dipeptidase